jgi:Tfp pilus assembly protein FimV
MEVDPQQQAAAGGAGPSNGAATEPTPQAEPAAAEKAELEQKVRELEKEKKQLQEQVGKFQKDQEALDQWMKNMEDGANILRQSVTSATRPGVLPLTSANEAGPSGAGSEYENPAGACAAVQRWSGAAG